ncbi:MAG: phosphoribosylformimino-5-aminoimidazole carboxamide ribotide isomerase [Desulfobulbaceae bacterium]|nr:phosphoribosylformimino-5-aminoimidazole carboxamide ribotide isomerase [Desulfobulbaceae bacterium]
MKFRPCIDLHDGLVKQIVGSSLSDDRRSSVEVNFVAEKTPAWFAELYRTDKLVGGHIIKLGPGNDAAAKEALAAWPGGMQIGGAIDAQNAELWLECGASHIIVTSYVFKDGKVDMGRLQKLVRTVGKEKIVLDLSCRKKEDDYFIVTDRWQKFTDVSITEKILAELSGYCDEFLIHAADVEGKCSGIEMDLVEKLGNWTPLPTTYAGGIRDFEDLSLIQQQGQGRLDFTVGSALDIFGGTMSYDDTVRYCRH